MTKEQFERGSTIRRELLNLKELKNLLNKFQRTEGSLSYQAPFEGCSTFHLNLTTCEDLINSLQEVVEAYKVKLEKEFEAL